jgi:PilZ domain
VISVRTTDIGLTGMGIVAPSAIPRGTRVTVRLGLPRPHGEKEPFDTEAEVVNCVLSSADQGFKTGLRFLMSDGSSPVLSRWLQP